MFSMGHVFAKFTVQWGAFLAALLLCMPFALAQNSGSPVLPGAAQNEDVFFDPTGQDTAGDRLSQSKEDLETEIRTDAFDSALDGLLPLRPDEIRKLLERYDQTQESVELPVYPHPKPEVAVQTIPLDPGTQPAIVNVSQGHVTTLTILDMTGAPWPIEDISWAGNFEIVAAIIT